jgi:hypothetical protein
VGRGGAGNSIFTDFLDEIAVKNSILSIIQADVNRHTIWQQGAPSSRLRVTMNPPSGCSDNRILAWGITHRPRECIHPGARESLIISAILLMGAATTIVVGGHKHA